MKTQSHLLTAALAGLVVTSAIAQNQAEPRRIVVRPAAGGSVAAAPGGALGGFGSYGAPLDLTDKQKAALTELSAANSKKITAIFQNKELSQAQKSEQYTALQKDYQKAVNELYTPEQREKLAKFQEDQRKRAEESSKKWTEFNTKGGFPGLLGLSDEQKAQWAAAEKEQAEKMRELQESLVAKQRELQEAARAKQRAMLTDEQKKKLEELQKEYPYAGGWGGGVLLRQPANPAPKKN